LLEGRCAQSDSARTLKDRRCSLGAGSEKKSREALAVRLGGRAQPSLLLGIDSKVDPALAVTVQVCSVGREACSGLSR
jgi:hypothetical protein